jgi:hypothetical protein
MRPRTFNLKPYCPSTVKEPFNSLLGGSLIITSNIVFLKNFKELVGFVKGLNKELTVEVGGFLMSSLMFFRNFS